jgi:TrmH family RNA methyltransferase
VSTQPWSIDRILELRFREHRQQTESHFVEGVRFLVSAVDAGCTIRSLVVAPAMLHSPLGQTVVRRLRRQGIPTLLVTCDEFRRVSRAETPQGVGVVLAQRWETIDKVAPAPRDCWVAVGEVRSQGNLGTLMRSAAACGATGIIVPRSGAADPYDPSAARAAMGALASMRIVKADPSEIRAWKLRMGLTVVGATPAAVTDYRAISYRRPVVLMLGSERKGLTSTQLALCDAQVRIPMSAGDSLNLAVAGSVLLYEVWNQRHPVHRDRA